MRRRGIDISGRRSKHLRFAGRRFDHVITLCDRLREVCPEIPGRPERIHWSIPDPGRGPTDEDDAARVRAHGDELDTRIGFLIQAIEHTTTTDQEATDRA